ncbi:MAG: ADP-ribose pyrophosphatase [Anaerolineae bacterium]|nr:ADP-ribose pyrophosphatase [Anaerolineae bacterium]
MEELVKREYAYQGRVLNLRLDTVRVTSGDVTLREIAEHHGAVAILPLDEAGNVTLVKQWRAATGRVMLEIPAGTLEPNEEPSSGAPRELKEETGLTAARWDFLARFFPSPGILTEEMFLYLARALTRGAQQLMDDEEIEIVTLSLDDALARIATGEIADAKTIVALLLTREKLRTMA